MGEILIFRAFSEPKTRMEFLKKLGPGMSPAPLVCIIKKNFQVILIDIYVNYCAKIYVFRRKFLFLQIFKIVPLETWKMTLNEIFRYFL